MKLKTKYRWFSDYLYVFHFTIFSILGIFSLFWLLSITRHSYGADYGIYFDAYVHARSGISPYLPYAVGAKFVNHPIVLLMVRLLFFEDAFFSKLIWSGVSITAWLGCIYLSVKTLNLDTHWKKLLESLNIKSIWLITVFLFFGPFLETIAIGQINTLPLFFILASLFLAETDKPLMAGISIGLAILLKTSPLIFLGYFILVRKYRIVFYAVVAMFLMTLLSQIPFPIPVVAQFGDIFPRLANEIHPTEYNQSLNSIAFRLLLYTPIQDLKSMIPTANKLILGSLFIVLAWLKWRSPVDSLRGRLWLFSSIQILTVVFSPLVWYHHYTFLLFPLILLLTEHSVFHRLLGISALTLFQVERFFEYYAVSFPWPALIAMLLLLIIAFVIFIRLQLNKDWQANFPSAVLLEKPS